MFRMTYRAPEYKFDGVKFVSTYRDILNRQIRQAAREFVRHAIVMIPIDTGQARGTFLPLGRFLRVAIPIPGNEPEKNKNPDTGAGPENRLIFQFKGSTNNEIFEIHQQLFYFWLNDFIGNPKGSHPPWSSLDEGWAAFMEYMRTVAPTRLPRLKDFISVSYRDYTL